MQWLNLTKCILFYNIVSPVIHTPLPLVLQCLDSHSVDTPILTLKKRPQQQIWLPHKSDTASHLLFFFFMLGPENSQMVPNQDNMGKCNQPVQTHSCIQQPLQPQTCVQKCCPGEAGLRSFVFQAVLTWLPFRISLNKLAEFSPVSVNNIRIHPRRWWPLPFYWWHQLWPSLVGKNMGVSSAWTAIWSLTQSGESNIRLGWGNVVENRLDLLQSVLSWPVAIPAWCAFDQAP